jgi:hypothetical protein
MGWFIVGAASLQETPEDRSVIISRIDRNTEVIDEPNDRSPVWLVKSAASEYLLEFEVILDTTYSQLPIRINEAQ